MTTGPPESSLLQPSEPGAVPHVLFVDDSDQVDPAQLQTTLRPHGVEVRLRHPEETLRSDLDWADLVVVDYFLTSWPERDDTASVARAPYNGLAAAAAMRSALLPALTERGPGSVLPRSVAFALWSSNLTEATFDLPEVVLPHVFSRENNLEWAFRRDDLLYEQGGRQIALLAQSVTQLPDRWPPRTSEAERQLMTMLSLVSAESDAASEQDLWHEDARREVLDCRPPLHELSERSHGLALLRWLLHRILPYPCFLLDDRQLCARLRVEAIEGGESTDLPLLEALEPYRYAGTLAGFDGRRWWRAGVEDWIFNATNGQSGNPRAVAALALRHGAATARPWLRPVLVINGDLVRSPDFAEVEQTVRVRPDDWPVYADDAYALRAEASEDQGLRALVEPPDRPLLDRGSDGGDEN
jgi:hypothetical protein